MQKLATSKVETFTFRYRRKLVCLASAELLILLYSPLALGVEKYFDASALELEGPDGIQPVDLSRFTTPGKQLPGIYHVDIFINNKHTGKHDVNFVEDEEKNLTPEILLKEYRNAGLKINDIKELKNKQDTDVVTGLDKIIDGAYTNFNFKKQSLNINIPQALMNKSPIDYIDPSQWDNGLLAMFSSYDLSGAQSLNKTQDSTEQDQYLGLRNGVNLGAWRLRNYTTYSHNSSGNDQWDNINTYLQRDISQIKGKLTLGDDSTQDDVFDSFAFSGIRIASEDRMLTNRESGFAPVIRGIAKMANAQITVRQGGYIVYQSYVPAGPFELTDLFPSTGGGDLQVTIKESDGSERIFTQSFGSVPIMQREGHLKYELMAGKYNNESNTSADPNVLLVTGLYGLPHDTTLYGGITKSEKYSAGQAGYGMGLGIFGSVSIDATQAITRHQEKELRGKAYRLKYSKSVSMTGTEINASVFHFPDENYYTFEDSLNISESDPQTSSFYTDKKRNRYEVSLSQPLSEYGSISLYASRENYWINDPENYFSLSYNGNYNGMNLSLSYSYTHSDTGEPDRQLALNVQIPLESLLPQTWANYSMTSDSSHHITQTVGINGTLLEERNLNYGINGSKGSESDGGSITANYKRSQAEFNGNYSETLSTRRLSYGMRGAIVTHPYGVTLSQYLSDDTSLALVRIPDQGGVPINNGAGIKTDSRGYAVIPNLQPYRINDISINTERLDNKLDITSTINHVTPSDGAMILANFSVRSGERVLMTLSRPANKSIPFGAMATAGEDTGSSIVADDGLVYLIGMPRKGIVKVTWGEENSEQCEAPFELPAENDTAEHKISLVEIDALCI